MPDYDVMDYSLPGFSDHRITQARILKRVTIPSPGNLPERGVKPVSLELAGGFFSLSHQGILIYVLMCDVRFSFFNFTL